MKPGSFHCPDCGPIPHEANPNTQPDWSIDWDTRPCPKNPDASHDICIWNPTPQPPVGPGGSPDDWANASGVGVTSSHNSYPGSARGGCYRTCVIYVDFYNVIEAVTSQLANCGPQTEEFILVGLPGWGSRGIYKAKQKKNFRTIVAAAESGKKIKFYTFEWGSSTPRSRLSFP